jgi:hypothetical protein
MNATLTDSASSLETDRTACVEWPLTSLMPKISEDGNDVDTFTARFGDVDGASTSSSTYCTVSGFLKVRIERTSPSAQAVRVCKDSNPRALKLRSFIVTL